MLFTFACEDSNNNEYGSECYGTYTSDRIIELCSKKKSDKLFEWKTN